MNISTHNARLIINTVGNTELMVMMSSCVLGNKRVVVFLDLSNNLFVKAACPSSLTSIRMLLHVQLTRHGAPLGATRCSPCRFVSAGLPAVLRDGFVLDLLALAAPFLL